MGKRGEGGEKRRGEEESRSPYGYYIVNSTFKLAWVPVTAICWREKRKEKGRKVCLLFLVRRRRGFGPQCLGRRGGGSVLCLGHRRQSSSYPATTSVKGEGKGGALDRRPSIDRGLCLLPIQEPAQEKGEKGDTSASSIVGLPAWPLPCSALRERRRGKRKEKGLDAGSACVPWNVRHIHRPPLPRKEEREKKGEGEGGGRQLRTR